MAKLKHGRGKAFERYVMETLRVMYEAGEVHFTITQLCTWGGMQRSARIVEICEKLVNRGWLHIVPAEQLHGRKARTYSLLNAVWFGVKEEKV